MIESPLIQEIVAARTHENILAFLEARFGPIPVDLATALQAIYDEQKLKDLVTFAALCPSLEAFRARVQA